MLLPGGITQLFTSGKEIKQSSSFIDEYELVKSNSEKGIFTSTENGIATSVEQYIEINKQLGIAHDKELQFIKDVEAGNIQLKEGESLAKAYTRTYENGLSKIGKIGKNLFSTLKNMAVSFGVSLVASLALDFIIKTIDLIWNKEKYIKQAADEAKSSIESMNSEFQNTNKTVSEIKDRYAELAQGVGNLGTVAQNQGNLSLDEYNEFLNISNQLAELFPQLTTGYDDNGNAILNLSGNVDTIVGSLNDLVDAERAAANQNTLDNMSKLWSDYDQNINKTKDDLQELKDDFEGIDTLSFDEQRDSLATMFADKNTAHKYGGGNEFISKAFERNGLSLGSYYVPDLDAYDFSDLTEEQIKNIMLSFDNIRSEYLAQVKEYENTIDQSNKEIAQYVAQAAKTVDYYDGLSEPMQKLMEGYIKNFDFDALQEEYGGNWTAAYDAFQSTLRESFGSVSDEDKALIDSYYNQLFTPDGDVSELTLEQIRNLAQQIVAVLGGEFSEFDILNALGLGDRFNKAKGQKERLSAALIKEGSFKDRLGQAEEISNFVDSLSEEQLAYLETEIHIDKNTSLADIKEALEEMQKVADAEPIETKVTASDAVDSMADAKTAITSLEELWNQTVQNSLSLGKDKKYLDENGNVIKQLNDKNQAVGFADPSTINSVESAFSKFSEQLEKQGNDAAANKINAALENFEKTLVEFPGEAGKAQDAIDGLITAYIDQTDIIKNLTEENAKWSIAQLEAYGITNAEEVVMSRLTQSAKNTSKAISKLSDTFFEYADAINKADKSSDDYKTALNDIKEGVTGALSYVDESGEVTFAPQIDDSFVERHMEDIQLMAQNDEAALERVRRAATQEAIMRVLINIPTDVAESQMNQIMGYIDQVNAENIEVGASINDAPFLSGLANMMRSSQQTADAVAAAFESMGYTVKLSHKYAKAETIAYYAKNGANGMPSYVPEKMEQMMSIPELTITRNGTAGARAVYGGSPKSSSGGSGGGGGGGGGSNSDSEPNKPKEESEESFDWIEVAIQRIEEEIARLDKVVGNSYDIWIHRNSALLKELEKTKEEIKAQQIAQSEYLRNANAVKVNDGKGLNPDDYGENDQLVKAADQKLLDEARKAWATGQYQRKVMLGQMSGDDIEKIENHFLSDTIKTFQEL